MQRENLYNITSISNICALILCWPAIFVHLSKSGLSVSKSICRWAFRSSLRNGDESPELLNVTTDSWQGDNSNHFDHFKTVLCPWSLAHYKLLEFERKRENPEEIQREHVHEQQIHEAVIMMATPFILDKPRLGSSSRCKTQYSRWTSAHYGPSEIPLWLETAVSQVTAEGATTLLHVRATKRAKVAQTVS